MSTDTTSDPAQSRLIPARMRSADYSRAQEYKLPASSILVEQFVHGHIGEIRHHLERHTLEQDTKHRAYDKGHDNYWQTIRQSSTDKILHFIFAASQNKRLSEMLMPVLPLRSVLQGSEVSHCMGHAGQKRVGRSATHDAGGSAVAAKIC